jgi:uncharacterized protein (TIGR00661 family)
MAVSSPAQDGVSSKTGAKRIVVGVCGYGNGHSSRALNLVDQLIRRGHRVALITFRDGLRALSDNFSKSLPIVVPTHYPGGWLAMNRSGIDIAQSAINGARQEAQGDAWSFRLAVQVVEALDGEPEVVMSDYEPASAQIAYMFGSRLITTEQQSKYLMYQTPDVAGHSRFEEAARIRYFFPAVDQRVGSSFFPMQWEQDPRYPGRITEPVLRPEVAAARPQVDETKIVVYISPFGPMGQDPEEVLTVMSKTSRIRFEVFCKDRLQFEAPNVRLSPFDRTRFTEELATCSGVISTAGHQLIAESLYLRKPFLAMPFDVYEQRFAAWMVEQHGFGTHTDRLTYDVLSRFLARRAEFAESAETLAAKQFTGDSNQILDDLSL